MANTNTVINYNGSTFAGGEAQSIEALLDLLATEPLNPTFERYGDFAMLNPTNDAGELIFRGIRFWGNFLNVSHAFSIDTDDQSLIERLIAAIKANKATTAYRMARK